MKPLLALSITVALVSLPSCRTSDVSPASAPDLRLGQMVPNQPEAAVVGAATMKIRRGTPEFGQLRENRNPQIVFKDEERTGADRMMTASLSAKLDLLATRVAAEWSGVKLRVTEAWDEDDEHTSQSTHYEARGADITTSDQDTRKYGRLGRLAVEAGLEWVFYEAANHVHVSMPR